MSGRPHMGDLMGAHEIDEVHGLGERAERIPSRAARQGTTAARPGSAAPLRSCGEPLGEPQDQ